MGFERVESLADLLHAASFCGQIQPVGLPYIPMQGPGSYDKGSILRAVFAEAQAKGQSIPIYKNGEKVSELQMHPPAPKLQERGCLKSAEFFISDDFERAETGFEDFLGEIPEA